MGRIRSGNAGPIMFPRLFCLLFDLPGSVKSPDDHLMLPILLSKQLTPVKNTQVTTDRGRSPQKCVCPWLRTEGVQSLTKLSPSVSPGLRPCRDRAHCWQRAWPWSGEAYRREAAPSRKAKRRPPEALPESAPAHVGGAELVALVCLLIHRQAGSRCPVPRALIPIPFAL